MLDAKFKNGYDQKVFERFIARNHYFANSSDDPDAYKKLSSTLGNESVFPQNLAYFLSVRPTDFAPVVEQLSGVGLLLSLIHIFYCGSLYALHKRRHRHQLHHQSRRLFVLRLWL